jgi:predicted TIM-barrel fold metal-dependent hydrolase
LRETLTRVLRSYGLARGDTAAGILSFPSTGLLKTDCDFDADAWDRGEQQALAASGIGRVVMNRLPAMATSLSPLAESAQPAWRAVIDVLHDTGRASLAALHANGVRGVRFDIGGAVSDSLDPILKFADRVVPFGWHVEINVGAPGAYRALSKAEWSLMQFPLAVCFVGLGGFRQGRRANDANLDFLLGMVQLGRYWLKLCSDDLAPSQLKLWDEPPSLALALQTVRKDRLIWGSGKQSPGDGAAHMASGLAMLEKCLPHPADREQVLIDNPAQLYGFDNREM